MPIATGLALGLGIAGAAGSIGSAAIGANAAGKAANTQANAANHAADLQHQDAQDALAFQNKQFDTSQANFAPFVKAGQGAVTDLSSLLSAGQNGTGALAPWTDTFKAPTDVTEQNDPGYQFRLKTGLDALQNSAAARGGLLSGGTAKAINDYAQNSASSEYGNVYNRAFNDYSTRYNQFQNNQSNLYNRYANLAGLGQTSTAQLGQLGQSAANNVSNTLLTSGAQIGNQINNSAAARASGYVGGANAIAGGINGVTGSIGQSALLSQLLSAGNNNFGSASSIANSDTGLAPIIDA